MAGREKISNQTHGRVASAEEVAERVDAANCFNSACAEFRAAAGNDLPQLLQALRERLGIKEPAPLPEASPALMLEILRKLNGELIAEKSWLPSPELLVEIWVSGPSDNQVRAKLGKEGLPPGASLEFHFKGALPEGVTIYAMSDEGDIVRPNRDPRTLNKVSLDFAPLLPDSSYHFVVDGLPEE
jgi:hypothetical protein